MLVDYNILYYEKVSSTNVMAADLIKKKKAGAGSVIVSGYQSSGKGQRNNTWISDPLMNLTMSVILTPKFLKPEKQFYISKIVSLALVKTLNRYSEAFSIKWPNDIYHKGDKIAGILIENSIIGNKISDSVCGIGLNINQTLFPDYIPNPVSLKTLSGSTYNIQEIQDKVLAELALLYSALEGGDFGRVDNDYLDVLYLHNKESEFKAGDNYFRGIINGVNDSGQLLVLDENGTERCFSFKEIEFL